MIYNHQSFAFTLYVDRALHFKTVKIVKSRVLTDLVQAHEALVPYLALIGAVNARLYIWSRAASWSSFENIFTRFHAISFLQVAHELPASSFLQLYSVERKSSENEAMNLRPRRVFSYTDSSVQSR